MKQNDIITIYSNRYKDRQQQDRMTYFEKNRFKNNFADELSDGDARLFNVVIKAIELAHTYYIKEEAGRITLTKPTTEE